MKRWATICRYGGVGDNLVASSVLPGLKKRYDGVTVMTQEPYHVVFENNPHVDQLQVFRKDEIPGNGWQEWHMILAKGSKDGLFVNLSHSMETTLAFLPAQCQFQWPAEARRKMANKSYLEQVHDICGIPYDEIAPAFFPTAEEVARAGPVRNKLEGKPVIGWVLTGTRIDKVYPYAAMAVARLITDIGANVVLFGHPEKDKDDVEAIHDHVGRQNGSVAGLHFARNANPLQAAWPLRDVLTLVQLCDLVIGPDTGPMWAVSMCEMPKIVLLSHASPENITKHWVNTTALHADQARVPCWPCHLLHDVIGTCTPNKENRGAACISDISVETILAAAKKALDTEQGHLSSSADLALSPGATLSYVVGVDNTKPTEQPATDRIAQLAADQWALYKEVHGCGPPVMAITTVWPDAKVPS